METQTFEDDNSDASSFCLSQMKNQFQNAMEIIKSDDMSQFDKEIKIQNEKMADFDLHPSWNQT